MKEVDIHTKVSSEQVSPAFGNAMLGAVPSSEVHLEDCVKALKRFNDKHFDLAIVDPPYGINASKGTWGSSNKGKVTDYGKKDWDKAIPTEEYFLELQRVSKNQIIWGGNYFGLQPSSCWLVWDKLNSADFADCEMAWTSFDKLAKIYRFSNPKNEKIHPTEKPVRLYNWLLDRYAERGMKILDTHLGSGNIAVACHYFGVDLVGCEIDTDYFTKAKKNYETNTAQTILQF